MSLAFIQLTDLSGHPVAIRSADVEYVTHPASGEYEDIPRLKVHMIMQCNAVLHFKNGAVQGVYEKVADVMFRLNLSLTAFVPTATALSTKVGGNHGGPVIPTAT